VHLGCVGVQLGCKISRRSFGKIRVLRSGRLQASYRGPDRARHLAPITFTARTDAEGWLRDERRLIENETWTSPAARAAEKARLEASPLFKDYAEQWVATRRTGKGRPIRESTAAGYRAVIKAHLDPTFGEFKVKDITKEAVRAWYRTLDPTKPRMASKAYGQLRAIMNTAVDEDLVATSPVRIRGAGASAQRRKLEPASLKELQTIADNMPERFRLMIWLASWCALRYGEIAELRRSDVVIARGGKSAVITVRRGVVFLKGETRVTSPKSDAGVRDVAVPPHLIPTLKEHLARHCAKGPDELMFPADGGGHVWASVVGKRFRAARATAGRKDLRFHDLRHTGAVQAAQQGATIADLQARLGHSTAGAALLYQHTAKGRDQLIAEKLSKLRTTPRRTCRWADLPALRTSPQRSPSWPATTPTSSRASLSRGRWAFRR
jgi:integrase